MSRPILGLCQPRPRSWLTAVGHPAHLHVRIVESEVQRLPQGVIPGDWLLVMTSHGRGHREDHESLPRECADVGLEPPAEVVKGSVVGIAQVRGVLRRDTWPEGLAIPHPRDPDFGRWEVVVSLTPRWLVEGVQAADRGERAGPLWLPTAEEYQAALRARRPVPRLVGPALGVAS